MTARRLVVDYGAVFSISERGWRRWLLALARGEETSLTDCGARPLAHTSVNITDMTPLDAREALADMGDTRAMKALAGIEYDHRGWPSKEEA